MKKIMCLMVLVAVAGLFILTEKGQTRANECTNARLALENYYDQCVITGSLMTIQKYAAMGRNPGQAEKYLIRQSCLCMIDSYSVENLADAVCQFSDSIVSTSFAVDMQTGKGKCTGAAPWR